MNFLSSNYRTDQDITRSVANSTKFTIRTAIVVHNELQSLLPSSSGPPGRLRAALPHWEKCTGTLTLGHQWERTSWRTSSTGDASCEA